MFEQEFYNKLKQLAPRGKPEILDGIAEYRHLLDEVDITPGPRRQMFLAQLAHESDGFHTTREYASGQAYENRQDLGNVEEGDGVRFRGRGLIQLTGRYNYAAFSNYVRAEFGWPVDYLIDPQAVELFPAALLAATWFWNTRRLNVLADAGDFRKITRRINGGLNGLADRERYLRLAQELDL